MPPNLAVYDFADVRRDQAKSTGKSFFGYAACIIQGADFQNLGFCYFGRAMHYAFRISAFGDGISIIVRTGAQKQVIGANAVSDITMMADNQAVRYRTIGKFIGVAVGSYIVLLCAVMAYMEKPVTVAANAPGPEPTSIRLFNKLPKPINWTGPTRMLRSTMTGATTELGVLRVGTGNEKLTPAIGAISRDGWYTFHTDASYTGVGRAGGVCAPPGLSMPNYTTKQAGLWEVSDGQ